MSSAGAPSVPPLALAPAGGQVAQTSRALVVTTPRTATLMSSSRTKYALTPRQNADGTAGPSSADPAQAARLTPRDLQKINHFLASNTRLNHSHRAGRVTSLIPPTPFVRVDDDPADSQLMLKVAPVHPKESALDVPLRFAAPAHFHTPVLRDARSATTLPQRLVALLKGASAVPSHHPLDQQGLERDVVHNSVVRDYELRVTATKRAGLARNEAMAHFALGSLHYNAGALEGALAAFAASAALFEQLGDAQGVALCHNLLGVAYYRLSEFKMALVHFKRQEALCAAYGRCVAQTNQGVCYTALGELQYAELALADALTSATDSQDSVLLSIANGNLGVAAMRLGDMKRAQTHLELCLEQCSLAGDKVGAAVCLLLLGEIFTQVTDFQHAQFYYEHAFRVAEETACRDVTEIARVSVGVARGNQRVMEAMLATARKMGQELKPRDLLVCLPKNV